MIHELATELRAELRALGVPVAVIDGPEPTTTTTWGRERIVVAFNEDGSDSFVQPRALRTNARHRYTAREACKVTIYAQSPAASATSFEHRARAKRLRDHVLVAFDVVAAKRRNRWSPDSGRFIAPEDLDKSGQPKGAVYELLFTFEQAVPVLTWKGEGTSEGLISSVQSRTDVAMTYEIVDDLNPPETACGA